MSARPNAPFFVGQHVVVASHSHPFPVGKSGVVVACGPRYVRVELHQAFASVICTPDDLLPLAEARRLAQQYRDDSAATALHAADYRPSASAQALDGGARRRAEWGPTRAFRVGGEGTPTRANDAAVEDGSAATRRGIPDPSVAIRPLSFFAKRAVAPRMSLKNETRVDSAPRALRGLRSLRRAVRGNEH